MIFRHPSVDDYPPPALPTARTHSYMTSLWPCPSFLDLQNTIGSSVPSRTSPTEVWWNSVQWHVRYCADCAVLFNISCQQNLTRPKSAFFSMYDAIVTFTLTFALKPWSVHPCPKMHQCWKFDEKSPILFKILYYQRSGRTNSQAYRQTHGRARIHLLYSFGH